MRCAILGVVLVTVASTGCGNQAAGITYVAPDDPQMQAAINKARATVPQFVRALRSPGRTRSGFAVKAPFSDGRKEEHIWLSPVTYDGKTFRGTVNNEPVDVKTVRFGQQVEVEPARISDWMYTDNKNLVGGFTLRVIRERMSERERADFDRGVPFTFN
jgi:uncharacterized protein YegJ (DUF2314 family)